MDAVEGGDTVTRVATKFSGERARQDWDLPAALDAAAAAAARGRDRVTPIVARKGRASYLGERSAGHQDPGATSTTILFESLRDALRAG